MPTNPSDEPAAQAHALIERLFALLHDCRAVVPQLEAARTDREPISAQAERLLYFALVGAIEASLRPGAPAQHGPTCTRPRRGGRRTILSPAPGLSGWRRWRRDPGESGASNLHTREAIIDQPILRLLIQQKIADGRLPHDPFPSIRSRQGTGETCDGCEGAVTRAQMLMEILDARGCRVQVHIACYYLWVAERQAYGREPSVRLPARSGFEMDWSTPGAP